MDEIQAIKQVRDYAAATYPDYPTHSLIAEAFESGWVVFAESDPTDINSLRVGQTIFLVGRNGKIMESSSSLPPGVPEAEFTRLYGQP